VPNTQSLENADVGVVGAPFDTGATFRAGARFVPEGIRSASYLLRRYNPSLDVGIFDHLSVIYYGDVPVVPGYIEESYRRIERGLEPIHNAGVVPIGMRRKALRSVMPPGDIRVHGREGYHRCIEESVDANYVPLRGVAWEPTAGILERSRPTGRGGDDA